MVCFPIWQFISVQDLPFFSGLTNASWRFIFPSLMDCETKVKGETKRRHKIFEFDCSTFLVIAITQRLDSPWLRSPPKRFRLRVCRQFHNFFELAGLRISYFLWVSFFSFPTLLREPLARVLSCLPLIAEDPYEKAVGTTVLEWFRTGSTPRKRMRDAACYIIL